MDAFDEYGVTLTSFDALETADLIVLAGSAPRIFGEDGRVAGAGETRRRVRQCQVEPVARRHQRSRSRSMAVMKTRAHHDQPA
ncbi:MAG: hypothetical protein CBARDMAM_0546 [uncultured Caballeronia sp.]|nr:MAG: hypothetical protein CBARDMAM_0546 [uncultured Caballeronia sp.]